MVMIRVIRLSPFVYSDLQYDFLSQSGQEESNATAGMDIGTTVALPLTPCLCVPITLTLIISMTPNTRKLGVVSITERDGYPSTP